MVQMRAPGKNDERIYHGIVWGLALVLSIIPVFTGSYGAKGLKSYWYLDSSHRLPLLIGN